MATLEEPSLLLQTGSGNGVIGVSRAVEDDCIVVTRKRDVEVMNLVDQKCVATWSVEMDSTLTASCISCSSSYYAVRDTQYILWWSPDAPSLQADDSAASLPIFNLHGITSVNQPIVVLINATVHLLGQCLETKVMRPKRTRKQVELDCKVVSSDTCDWQNNETVGIAVTVKMTRAASLVISVHQVTESSCTPWIETGMEVPLDSSKFQNICLSHNERGHLELISVWSDSTLWSQSLPADGSLMSPWQIMKFSSRDLTALDTLSICTMGSSRLAVLEVRRSTENTECCISVVDTKFKTVNGKTSFQSPSTAEEDYDEPQQCQITQINGFLVAVCDLNVFLTRCEISMPLLLSVVGRQSNTDLVPPPVTLSGPAWLAAANDEIKVSIEDPWFENLFDSQKTPNAVAFDAKYGANVGETKPQRSKKEKKDKKSFCVFTEEQSVEAKLLDAIAGQHILIQTVLRCLSDTTFWPCQSLLDMIERFSVPASCSLDLFSLAIKHNDAAVVAAALVRSQDIDETALVLCLDYVLRLDESFSIDYADSKSSTLGQIDLLCLLLSKPKNDFLICSSLKLLPYSQVLKLMKLLSTVLTTSSRLCGNRPEEQNEMVISETDAVDWISLLIDAHFAQLVLDPQAKRLLMRLSRTVSHQVKFCQQLNGIDELLANITESVGVEKRKQFQQYTIELLNL